MKRYVNIDFRGKSYPVDIEIFEEVISRLTDRKIKLKNEKQILEYFSCYGLYDEVFLKNINRLAD